MQEPECWQSVGSMAVEHRWEGFPVHTFSYFPNFGPWEPIQKLNLRKSNEEKHRTHCPQFLYAVCLDVFTHFNCIPVLACWDHELN